MKAYLRDRVDPAAVRKSIALGADETVDCVDATRQHGRGKVLALANPPADTLSEPGVASEAASGLQPTHATQRYGTDTEACGPGTVPVRRITLDEMRRFKTLKDYFSKVPSHVAARAAGSESEDGDPADTGHQYSRGAQFVDNWGMSAALNLWSPSTELANEFSLSQIWVVRGGDGAATVKQTVEAGWQVYRDKYSDSKARLFIYFTPDGYGSGGCYNKDCAAFVQTDNSVYIAGDFTAYSAIGGAQKEITLRWQKSGETGDWWLKYGTTWVGYYPRSLFNNGAIANYAGKIAVGGEIVDNRNLNLHTSTDMGSGRFASTGWQSASYERLIQYITRTSNTWADPSLSQGVTNSACYSISSFNYDSGGWLRHFYFGGPGYSSTCQ